MAVPEAPPGKQHPQMATPQGGMLVTTPMGPQSHTSNQKSVPVSDLTQAEQKAGKEASTKALERRQKEQEEGRRLMQQRGGGQPPQPPVQKKE